MTPTNAFIFVLKIINVLAWLGIAISLTIANAQAVELSTAQADQRSQCAEWASSGSYPSGVAQVRCEAANPGLPNPFEMLCRQQAKDGYDTDTRRRACKLFMSERRSASRTSTAQ